MFRLIGALVVVVLSVCSAQAQNSIFWPITPAYVGSTTALSSTGYNLTSGILYAAPATSLQFGLPFTVSFDIKSTVFGTSVSNGIVDTRNGTSTVGLGFFIGACETCTNSAFRFLGTVGNTVFPCSAPSQVCARATPLSDGNWHNACYLLTPNGASLYFDAFRRDANALPVSYTPSTGYFQLGETNGQSVQLRDLRVYTVSIGQSGCQTLASLNGRNLTPLTGVLQNNLAMHIPMNNCNSSGCADSSGNANNLIYDTSTPSCTITGAAAPGFIGLNGNQSLTATCSDSIGVRQVFWYVDGVFIGGSTTSPYTTTWATATYIDGTHTVTIDSVNIGGTGGTTSSTGTTTNGVSVKTVYLDPTSPTDCPTNSGLSQSTPCSTLAGAQSVIASNNLHGGDSILLQHGTTTNFTAMSTSQVLYLSGPSCGGACDGVPQNAFPGQVITISTYGGTGQCHIQAGITTDCATINLSANGASTVGLGAINVANLENVQISNFRIIGTQPNAESSSSLNYAVKMVAVNNYIAMALPAAHATIINVEMIDFFAGGWGGQGLNPFFSSFGQNQCGLVLTENYMHPSTGPSQQWSGGFEVNTASCPDPLASPVISFIANNVNDAGGTVGGQDGSGLFSTAIFTPFIDNFNVTGNGAYNSTQCGPYGNWWDGTIGGIVKGNESYNYFPNSGVNACDKGAFDLDNGTASMTLEFNYGHNTAGPAVNVLTGTTNGIVAGNNIVAYNIFENTNAQGNQNVSLISGAVATGFFNIYNNTIWNGFNGKITAPYTTVAQTAILGQGGCFTTPTYYANNIGVANSGSFVASAEYVFGGFGFTCASFTYPMYLTNDWFNIGTGTALWRSIHPPNSGTFGTSYTTLATWNAASPANDISSNPGFAGSPPLVTTCQPPGSGVPIQPGAIPCPTGYQITHGAATENAGTDLSQSPYSLYVTTQDFFTDTVPYTGHGGPGTNIGADGAFR